MGGSGERKQRRPGRRQRGPTSSSSSRTPWLESQAGMELARLGYARPRQIRRGGRPLRRAYSAASGAPPQAGFSHPWRRRRELGRAGGGGRSRAGLREQRERTKRFLVIDGSVGNFFSPQPVKAGLVRLLQWEGFALRKSSSQPQPLVLLPAFGQSQSF
jgi:hypothetical protein